MAYRNLAQGLETSCLAFDGDRLLVAGEAREVALAVKREIASNPAAQILVFDDETSRPIEIDYEGSDEDVLRWVAAWGPRPAPTSSGPGRPKLGVVPREITLLPRHWEWLDEQPGGASAALRRLVEEARRSPKEAARRAQEAAYRFTVTMAGDREGFEEASRALFANDRERFSAASEGWPPDVRDRARELLSRVDLPQE